MLALFRYLVGFFQVSGQVGSLHWHTDLWGQASTIYNSQNGGGKNALFALLCQKLAYLPCRIKLRVCSLHTLHCDLGSLKLVTASSFSLEDSHPCRLKGVYRSCWAAISGKLSDDTVGVASLNQSVGR